MTALIALAVLAGLALSVSVALVLARFVGQRDHPPAELPHRPQPGQEPPRRHRLEHAHTASYSAAAVLEAQRQLTAQRQAAMAAAVKRETGQ